MRLQTPYIHNSYLGLIVLSQNYHNERVVSVTSDELHRYYAIIPSQVQKANRTIQPRLIVDRARVRLIIHHCKQYNFSHLYLILASNTSPRSICNDNSSCRKRKYLCTHEIYIQQVPTSSGDADAPKCRTGVHVYSLCSEPTKCDYHQYLISATTY